MKKILLVLNHSLAGFGSDEQAQLKPSGKKAPLGPGVTLLPFLQKQGAEIVATLYCGDQYYLENEEEVAKKFIGFAKKFHADAVLCGPAMHYPNFGEMAARLACKFNAAGIPAIAAMAEENPAVSHYYQQVPIVKMPKKGGIVLNNSFKQMAQLVVAKANGKETKQLEETSCF